MAVSFRGWLRKQRDRRDEGGDLSRNARQDDCSRGLTALHLSKETLETAERAARLWNEVAPTAGDFVLLAKAWSAMSLTVADVQRSLDMRARET